MKPDSHSAPKIRLDALLVQRNSAINRDEAQRLIRAGKVLVDETVYDKPGTKVNSDVSVRILQRESSYAGRGGLKLEAALKAFGIDVPGKTAADLGASTGGFTDCLLQHGVNKVYAIDVGHGLLDYRLQQDKRVIVMDRTNCRYLNKEDLGEQVDIVVVDLSFISIKTVFPAVNRIMKDDGVAVFLVKPQFEIGKGRVGKKGIVRNTEDHIEVLLQCRNFFSRYGWNTSGIIPSPIKGKSGNIEFLLKTSADFSCKIISEDEIRALVQEAHEKGNIRQ